MCHSAQTSLAQHHWSDVKTCIPEGHKLQRLEGPIAIQHSEIGKLLVPGVNRVFTQGSISCANVLQSFVLCSVPTPVTCAAHSCNTVQAFNMALRDAVHIWRSCHEGARSCVPVLQVGEVKGGAAGPDVAVLVHVHLVIWCDEAVRPDVKLAPINQQGLLNVFLDHPL